MSKRCIHESEKHLCDHAAFRRTGPMVPYIGDRPACVLVSSRAEVCEHRQLPAPIDGADPDVSLWAELGR